MKISINYFLGVAMLLLAFSTQAERYKYENKSSKRGGGSDGQVAANCTPPTAASELNINNTRALIQTGGDMWWDFNRSRYEIPSGSGQTSLFAGSLWLAGQDVSGQFKVAALRFRQVGNDYWTGPLSTVDAEIEPQTCRDYDRHWETTRSMVAEYAAWYEAGVEDALSGTNVQEELFPGYAPPAVITEWPGNGRNFAPYNEDPQLAPYFDRNGDGEYNYEDGDYPGYVLSGKSDCSRRVKDLYGDQNLWWVFNDKGNVHTESSGLAIGMEIRAQAFAFATTDEVNNMTFYNYELINRSTFELRETFFGQWVDGDLGNPQDDYVGCDVRRGLGYFYNGDEEDEDAQGNIGYGANPPAIGVDFFQGPFQANDNKDNCLCVDYASAVQDDGTVYEGQGAGYGDDIVDNERYGMRKFLYHNNSTGPAATQDPTVASDYYNLMRGIWKDGTQMSFGGIGYAPGDANAIPAGYMFPGDTDPLNWGTDGIAPSAGDVPWTEVSAGNNIGDRRFVQSSGPFTLGPGAVNNITVGIVWMQASSGGRLASVELMRKADDKTQALFDSCFEILDGPDSPDMVAQELDQEIILMISNPINSNNYLEAFESIDPFLAAPDSVDTDGDGDVDTELTDEEKARYATYKFEGYQIYQLADASVGTNDLTDADKARLVAQVDIANDVERIINYEFDASLEADIPTLKVEGANNGIEHSFKVTEDLFSTGDARLVNHKTYYFMAVAYAYNAFGEDFGNLSFLADLYDPSDANALDGQKEPYLASRKSPSGPVKVIAVIPHNTDIEFDGVQLNAQYGDGVEITRIEGRGNGGNYLDISQVSIDELFKKGESTGDWTLDEVVYQPGLGPVNVKVVDPLSIKGGDFVMTFKDELGTGNLQELTWELTGSALEETITSDQAVWYDNEQIVFELGLSFTLNYGYAPFKEVRNPQGDLVTAPLNGYLGFEVAYEDENDQWLGGLLDVDSDPLENWIKSGDFLAPDVNGNRDVAEDDHFENYVVADPEDSDRSLDGDQVFENIAGRTWAPFVLTSYDTAHAIPMFPSAGSAFPTFSENILRRNDFSLTPGVNVYITKDKSKWTRCAVLEAQDNESLTEGGVLRGELRRGLSVDKDGRNQLDPGVNLEEATMNGDQTLGDLVSGLTANDRAYFESLGFDDDNALRGLSYGMGWFPGYAVNVETGERLNMAFSEDSWLGSENGADMQWNPTALLREQLFQEVRFGGKHLVYVFRHNLDQAYVADTNASGGFIRIAPEDVMPAYDEGDFIYKRLATYDHSTPTVLLNPETQGFKDYMSVMRAGAWVGYTMLAENSQLFGDQADGNDVVIKLRASKPYNYYATKGMITNPAALTVGTEYYVYSGRIETDVQVRVNDTVITASRVVPAGQPFVAGSTSYTLISENVNLVPTVNGGLPQYSFNTDAVAPTKSVALGEDALDLIQVVPNPYYAYSEYEEQRLDYLVKVVNLPKTCTVTIYNVSGTLVRTFNKDDATVTSIDWDLKNQDNIIIASGVYLIHVEAPGLGEKILKWFGVLRPLDLNSF